MRQLANTLGATIVLAEAQPLLLASVGSGLVLLPSTEVKAQSAEAVARIAEAVTVRIEGATQGSGVLVRQEGNRYIVLTAWHVIGDQKPGEELAVFTADGKQYQVEPGSIRKLGEIDGAELTFLSNVRYATATQGNGSGIGIGSTIYVAGFPVSTTAVPLRLLRVMEGKITASPNNSLPNGYQLLYSNPTMTGMSGGAIFDTQGKLIGIHARSEVMTTRTEQEDVLVKTGTGQGIPIGILQQLRLTPIATIPFVTAGPNQALPANTSSVSLSTTQSSGSQKQDYLAEAQRLIRTEQGRNEDVIGILDKAISDKPSGGALLLRAELKEGINDLQGAEADLNEYVRLSSANSGALTERAKFYYRTNQFEKAIEDLNNAIAASQSYAAAYYQRGMTLSAIGSTVAACDDMKMAASRGVKQAGDAIKKLCSIPSQAVVSNGSAVSAQPAASSNSLKWIAVVKSVTIEELAQELLIDESVLARLNKVNEDHQFQKGDWLAVPIGVVRNLGQVGSVDLTSAPSIPPQQVRRIPLTSSGVIRLGDTIAEIARRYGMSIAELLRLNPGLERARLVVGSQVRLAESAPQPASSQLWPATPQFEPDGSTSRRQIGVPASNSIKSGSTVDDLPPIPALLAAGGYGNESVATFSVGESKVSVRSGDQIGRSGWIFRRVDNGDVLVDYKGVTRWVRGWGR